MSGNQTDDPMGPPNPPEESGWDNLFSNPSNILGNAWDWLNTKEGAQAATAVLGGGLATYFGMDKPDPTGYQGGIPELTYNRQKLNIPHDPNRRPGSMGRRYFTDGTYSPKGIASVPPGNQTQPAEPGGGVGGGFRDEPSNVKELAQGGIAGIPEKADKGRYLRGKTGGMEDKIETNIDGEDPAALSHGEFVIPADVLAFLGGGNNEAGAAKMQEFMAAVRTQAKGDKEQINEVNADELMAGLLA